MHNIVRTTATAIVVLAGAGALRAADVARPMMNPRNMSDDLFRLGGRDQVAVLVVNERDELGDNTPFEYATAVKDSSFYGWPWYYIGSNEDPGHKGARPDLKGKVTVPDC